jgi:hypothetical protein
MQTLIDFEAQVIADLGELKAQMRSLIGNGQPGRIKELEARVDRHEAYVQRVFGLFSAAGALITLAHLVLDYLRLHAH